MKKFVLGFITAAMIFGSAGVYAATGGKMIEAFFNVKSIKFDGVAKTTTNTPFVYNGATYVPVRFIAENFGKEVVWDSKTQSVLINTKKEPNIAYLGSDVKYMAYKEEGVANAAKIVYNGTTSFLNSDSSMLPETVANDNLENQYKHFIALASPIHYDNKDSEASIEFPIKAGYTQFNGKLAIPEQSKNMRNIANVEFLIDGKVVYSKIMKAGSFPEQVSFSIKGGKKLTVRMIQDRSSQVNDKFTILIGNPIYK